MNMCIRFMKKPVGSEGCRVEMKKDSGKKMVLGDVKLQPDPMASSGT